MSSGNKVVISWIVSIGFVGMPEFMSSKTFALCRQRSFLHGPAGIRSDEEKENNFFGRVSFMDAALLLEYGWVLLVLIGLEGILAADNALVMAVMVKHLPEEKRKKRYFMDWQGLLFCDLALYSPFHFWSTYGRFKRLARFICCISQQATY